MLKYYKDCIIYNESINNGIAIVTGWSDKDKVYTQVDKDNKNKVVSCGQLYTKEGINYIIRNLFLNPHINNIVLYGYDLTGSLKTFYDFITKGDINFNIDKNIPGEAIREFINHFRNNITLIDSKLNIEDFNKALKQINTNNKEWCEPQLFPEEQLISPDTYPSEKMGIPIRANKVSEAWLRLLYTIYHYGTVKESDYGERQRELINLSVIVRSEDIKNPILPEYLQIDPKNLKTYCDSLLSDYCPPSLSYTYGQRINNYGNGNISQLDYMKKILQETPYSRRAVATLWNPDIDTQTDEVPCVNLMQAIIQDDHLYFTAFLRSNDLFNAWPKNAFGILTLQDYLCQQLHVKKGYINIISGSAHVYGRDFNNLDEIIKNHKISFCEEDERGYFLVSLAENRIKVTLCSASNEEIFATYGNTAQELRDKICRHISNIEHAFYIGSELQKAEIALTTDIPYKQDSNLGDVLVKKYDSKN